MKACIPEEGCSIRDRLSGVLSGLPELGELILLSFSFSPLKTSPPPGDLLWGRYVVAPAAMAGSEKGRFLTPFHLYLEEEVWAFAGVAGGGGVGVAPIRTCSPLMRFSLLRNFPEQIQ